MKISIDVEIKNLKIIRNTCINRNLDAHIVFCGYAGTGKSYLALYFKYLLEKEKIEQWGYEKFLINVFPNFQTFLLVYKYCPETKYFTQILDNIRTKVNEPYLSSEYEPDPQKFTEHYLKKSIILIDEIVSFQGKTSKEWQVFISFAETERFWNNIYFIVGQNLWQFRNEYLLSRVDRLYYIKLYTETDEKQLIENVKERKAYVLDNETLQDWLVFHSHGKLLLLNAFRTEKVYKIRYSPSKHKYITEVLELDEAFHWFYIPNFLTKEFENFKKIVETYEKYYKPAQSFLRRKYQHFLKVWNDPTIACEYIADYFALTYEKIIHQNNNEFNKNH